jgi:polysaccharide export outer membrane protein
MQVFSAARMGLTMRKKKPCRYQWKSFWSGLLVSALVFSGPVRAQSEKASSGTGSGTLSNAADEYRIGADDVLSISVADAPEFSMKCRVTEAGLIEMNGLSAPIHAAGQTAMELSHTIRQAFMDAKQLRDPKVSVYVEEYHGRTITVLGAVKNPAVYAMQKKTSVLDALSMAGGALPNAGSTITVVRGRASAEATGTEVGSVQIIDMNKLLRGENHSANVEVKNEDVISVSAAQVVYVVGAVTKPGGFVMTTPSEGISVVQAVALAEGLRPIAAGHKGVVIRQSTSDHARQEVPVDIDQMMAGKATDVVMAPNDILFVPESGSKKTLKAMGEVAMAAASGVAIYGLGYRAAGIHQ